MSRITLSTLVVLLFVRWDSAPVVCAETTASESHRTVVRLIKALDDKNVRIGASIALVKIGEKAVPALSEALKNGSTEVQIWSAFTLGEIGNSAQTSTGELTAALNHSDPEVRATAAQALGKIGDKSSVEALVSTLADNNTEVRKRVAVALGKIGPPADTATEALIQLLADDDVRPHAREALFRIGPTTIDKLREARSNDEFRFDAGDLLSRLAPNRRPEFGLDQLTEADLASLRLILFNERRPPIERKRAADSLAKISNKGVAILIEGFDVSSIERTAAEAFAKSDGSAIELLKPVLSHENANVRATAISAIEQMGPQASGLVEDLMRLLKDEDRNVRYRAVRALHTFGKQAQPAVAALGQVIANSGEQEPTRQWAIKTLIVTLPDTHDDVVKALIAGANEKQNYGVRQLALQFLRKIDPEAAKEAGLR